MSGTSFSALMPSVLRLMGGEESGCVHLAAQAAAPLAEWGRCFRSEEDVDRILQILEPLLVLLSLAGYGVPEVVLSAQGVPQPDRISVAMPSLEIRRGTARSWDADSSARAGLRVCPTATNPLDLGAELATFKLGFGPKACGWLLLPVSEADPRTSLDDSVQKLWLALAKKVAAASAGTGVAALIETARTYSPTKQLGMLAALPGLVAKASMALQALGAAAMLEAEFVADRLGKKLSEQMQELKALSDGASSLLARVESKGLVATTTEAFWGWWHDDETEEEPQDAPSLRAVEALGWVRALLSFVGTTQVQDTGKIEGQPTPQEVSMPLAKLIAIRTGKPEKMPDAEWAKFVSAAELSKSFVRISAGPSGSKPVQCTVPSYTFAHSTDLDGKTFPLLSPELRDQPLTHTLDFARTRFEMELGPDPGTSYLYPDAADAKDYKPGFYAGNSTSRKFWCSALSVWTLAASGYELDQDLLGAANEIGKREPHGYIDNNGWVAIRPWMLIDGQQEACLALGMILRNADKTDPREVPGQTVVFDFKRETGPDGKKVIVFEKLASIKDLSGIEKPIKTMPPSVPEDPPPRRPTMAQIKAAPSIKVKDGVAVGIASNGFLNPYVVKEFFESYDGATTSGKTYQDSPAVQFGPGAVQLMGIGRLVPFTAIRPGDIGQYHERRTGKMYIGEGHAFQVWSVKIKIGADEVILDRHTEPRADLATATAIEYRCIDANVSTASHHPSFTKGDGGVSISDWIPVLDSEKLDQGRRYYFARLHESPWSDANLAAAAKGAAAVPPSAPPR